MALVDDDEMATFLRVLRQLRTAPVDDPQRLTAQREVAGFVKDIKKSRRAARRHERTSADAEVLAASTMGSRNRPEDLTVADPDSDESVGELHNHHLCYVCKRGYRQVDARYHTMCPTCAAFNAERREDTADLRGYRALLTGGRVKIGFEVARRLLRDGAHLTVTSRFPRDTARRFAALPGSDQWWDRFEVVGVDLRDPRAVLAMCDRMLAAGDPLDILINNAAQTVRRPAWTYAPILEAERTPLTGLPATARMELVSQYLPGLLPAVPSLAATGVEAGMNAGSLAGFEAEIDTAADAAVGAAVGAGELVGALGTGIVDASGMLSDPSATNSWSAKVGQINPAELLEVHLVNAVAPFLLIDRLRPLLEASTRPRRYIVNVSAVEGWFSARHKTSAHPHTNMAKASLNMLTRTSAADLATRNIYMVSVDTGWVTDENPAPKKERIAASGWRPPLDVADGAARIYDPIVRGETGHPVHGVFLKDYRVVPW